MASGILGTADLVAATNTSVYTVPATKTASFAVNFTNRNAVPINVRLAVSTVSTPTDGEYVIYDAIINPNQSLERTGLVAQENKIVVAYSNSANVSVQVYGYEA